MKRIKIDGRHTTILTNKNMGRPTKKQVFIRTLLHEMETDSAWSDFRTALYKEYILHINEGTPRWLYDTIIEHASSYWDYMINNVDKNLSPEELITDMGDILENPVTDKMIQSLKDETVL